MSSSLWLRILLNAHLRSLVISISEPMPIKERHHHKNKKTDRAQRLYVDKSIDQRTTGKGNKANARLHRTIVSEPTSGPLFVENRLHAGLYLVLEVITSPLERKEHHKRRIDPTVIKEHFSIIS